jgi:putative FmdB family regulatory protein
VPSYDFRCQNCGHQFTVKLSVAERDSAQCPVCQSKSLSQRFTSMNYFRSGAGTCDASAGGSVRFG